MKLMTIALVLCFALLAGCTKTQVKRVPVFQKIEVDPSLTVPCEKLWKINNGMDMGQLMKDDLELRKKYTECAIRYDCLREAVKDQSGEDHSCPKIKELEGEDGQPASSI